MIQKGKAQMPHRDPEAAKKLDALSGQAEQLAKQIQSLGSNVGSGVAGLRSKTNRNTKAIWLLAGSFAFDIILTIIITITGVQVIGNSKDVSEVQKITRSGVLCPLYDIFLNSENAPMPRIPGETDQGYAARKLERQRAFTVIHKGHGLLECDKKGSNR